jgi:hypothetical protein
MSPDRRRPQRDQAAIIASAIEFDMVHIVRRYMRDHDIPAWIAARHERELKRYLILCALHPYAKYGMRGPVDELWHTFIFFTRDYFEFSQRVARQYMHHIPEDPDEVKELKTASEAEAAEHRKKKMEPYAKMLVAYSIVFGEAPPSDIWPIPWRRAPKVNAEGESCGSSCNSHCGNSCNGCGAGCSSCNGGCSGCNYCNSCGNSGRDE